MVKSKNATVRVLYNVEVNTLVVILKAKWFLKVVVIVHHINQLGLQIQDVTHMQYFSIINLEGITKGSVEETDVL